LFAPAPAGKPFSSAIANVPRDYFPQFAWHSSHR
jgi:hypothetical protein